MKIKSLIIVAILLIVGVFVWAKTSSKDNFVQAKDFPTSALIYLQTTDLQQVVKLWNESKLKEKYLESQNFKEFQNSHLGIKLAERFTDLGNATGFPIDLQTLSGLAEKQAAIAVYDIGKLDIVFIAPMNETVFSATMFAQHSANFEQNSLEDGTPFYILESDVDRQRQKQKVIFANIKGRFILATSEKLFLQTISAIKGKQRLYDEATFKSLSERITPNLATVWVNQEELNADYYFKRYWLMSDVKDLQNIRAGIFDLNLNETGLIEKREFLIKEPQNSAKISNTEAQNLISLVPMEVPFYRLRKVDEKRIGETIYNTIFDKQNTATPERNYSKDWSYYADRENYGTDYEYLDSKFEKDVNVVEEDEIAEANPFPINQISTALNSANPTTILTATSPKTLENPLFVEFRKIAIISLGNPKVFQSNRFENSIVEALKNRVSVADAKFTWETENDLRKLKIPLLGWEIIYQIKDNKLFISTSFELLQECFLNENKPQTVAQDFSDLTVINLTNREASFDNVMMKLAVNNDDFFVGNVASLLDAISDVKQIEIQRKSEGFYLHEEITAH